MTSSKLTYIFVAGMEGCGHHGLNPVLTGALECSSVDGRHPVIIRNKKRLKRILNWYWCKSHSLPFTRYFVRLMIGKFFRGEKRKSINNNEVRVIIEDNSFPAGRYRDPEKQWDIHEMVDIVGQYADEILLVGLYRDPVAATYSHQDFDGGLLEHAQVVKNSLIYINDQLKSLPEIKQLYIHYEDLLYAQEEISKDLAEFFAIEEDCVKLGLKAIRASRKDWRSSLSEVEKAKMMEVFDSEAEALWPLFSQAKRYSTDP